MLLWTWVYRYLFETRLSILLGIYTGIELVDHLVILFLILGGNAILFSAAAATFYMPARCAQCFRFLHILTSTRHFLGFYCCCCFIVTILTGVGWFLTVILICISLTITDVEHFSVCSLPTLYHLCRNFCSSPLPTFNCLFCYWVVEFLYILDTNPSSDVWSADIFSHSLACRWFSFKVKF